MADDSLAPLLTSARPREEGEVMAVSKPSPLRALFVEPARMVGGLWAHRELLWKFTHRAIEVRHRGSRLGALWALVNPLSMLVLYFIVSAILRIAQQAYITRSVYENEELKKNILIGSEGGNTGINENSKILIFLIMILILLMKILN